MSSTGPFVRDFVFVFFIFYVYIFVCVCVCMCVCVCVYIIKKQKNIYKKIIPYKGTGGGGHRVRCGYAVLSGQVKESGVRGSYVPLSGADLIYMMAVLSWARVVRVLCVCVAVSCWMTACVCARAAAECARVRLTIPTVSSVRSLL